MQTVRDWVLRHTSEGMNLHLEEISKAVAPGGGGGALWGERGQCDP